MAPDPIGVIQVPGLHPLAIYWYGVFMLAGAVVVLIAARLAVGAESTLARYIFPIWVFATVATLAGGRLAALLLGSTLHPLSVRGFVSAGGLALGALAGWLLARAWRLPAMRLADAFAPAAAFGEAVARVGTLLAGTGYGTPTSLPWGVVILNASAPVRPLGVPLHPTQIYLALGLMVVGGAAWSLGRIRPGQGKAAAAYLVGAGVLRVVVETVRGDRIPILPFLSVGDTIGLAFVATGLTLWWWTRTRPRRPVHVL